MGKPTTKAPEAEAATGVTSTPETPNTEVIEVNSDGVNQLLADKDATIADQKAKIEWFESLLEQGDQTVASLEAELKSANETIADLTAALDTATEKLETSDETETDKVLFESDGETYEILLPSFRYKGREYKSAEAVTEHPEVFEELIEAKSFIIKKQ